MAFFCFRLCTLFNLTFLRIGKGTAKKQTQYKNV